jgi:hypothetical protein
MSVESGAGHALICIKPGGWDHQVVELHQWTRACPVLLHHDVHVHSALAATMAEITSVVAVATRWSAQPFLRLLKEPNTLSMAVNAAGQHYCGNNPVHYG